MKKKYPNNHYDILLKHNETGKLFHFDGIDKSDSFLFVDIDFDINREYQDLISGDYSILPDGEYTYAMFWNTLDISIVAIEDIPLLETQILIDNNEFLLKDLRPDTGLAIKEPSNNEFFFIDDYDNNFYEL